MQILINITFFCSSVDSFIFSFFSRFVQFKRCPLREHCSRFANMFTIVLFINSSDQLYFHFKKGLKGLPQKYLSIINMKSMLHISVALLFVLVKLCEYFLVILSSSILKLCYVMLRYATLHYTMLC